MTKSQTFFYVATVGLIIVGAYLYTSIVEAPHDISKDTEIESTMPADGVETATSSDITLESLVVAEQSATSSEPIPSPSLPVVPSDTELSPSTYPLVGSSWVWQESVVAGATITPKQKGAFVLSFIDAGRMSSKTDCNSLGGEYKVSGTSLIFGEMVMTMMFCENSDEGTYGAQLQQVTNFRVEGDGLRLLSADGDTQMLFTLVN
jgi:heat shock protein HslJ